MLHKPPQPWVPALSSCPQPPCQSPPANTKRTTLSETKTKVQACRSSEADELLLLSKYLVEGLEELSGRRLLAILVKNLVEARQNLLPNAGHFSALLFLQKINLLSVNFFFLKKSNREKNQFSRDTKNGTAKLKKHAWR